jgi:SAM-dependent methyltransferase
LTRGAARLLVRAVALSLSRAGRVFERAGRALAVPTLTEEDLRRSSVEEWESFGEGGPIFGDEPFVWETDFYGRNIGSRDVILVAGAGNGRDIWPLLRAGHDVTALDITPRALETLKAKAEQRGHAVKAIQASIVDVALPPAAYDVVLFSWFCFAYLRGDEARLAALVRSSSALRKGGRILISYPKPPAGRKMSGAGIASRFVAAITGGVVAERGDDYVMSGGVSRPEIFYTHYFEPSDVEDVVRRAGLVVTNHEHPTYAVGVLCARRPEGVA